MNSSSFKLHVSTWTRLCVWWTVYRRIHKTDVESTIICALLWLVSGPCAPASFPPPLHPILLILLVNIIIIILLNFNFNWWEHNGLQQTLLRHRLYKINRNIGHIKKMFLSSIMRHKCYKYFASSKKCRIIVFIYT